MELVPAVAATGLAVLLVISALTAAAQAAAFHLNRARLRGLVQEGNVRARAVLTVMESPLSASGTLAVLHTLSLVGVGVFGALIVWTLLPTSSATAVLVVVAALVGGFALQALGRAIAVAWPEQSALWLYPPLRAFGLLAAPLIVPMRYLEQRLLKVFGARKPVEPFEAEDELRMLVEAAQDSHGLEKEEREMIHGVFELGQVTAREVMVPRIHIDAVASDAVVGEALDIVVKTGHSRIPVYEGSIDQVLGILHAKDLLAHLASGDRADPISVLARRREVFFVPEAKKIDDLLQEMQQRRVHMAIVIDEYGGTAGLVTIEDLIEEIVGEIRDEYDAAEEPPVTRVSDTEVIIDARTTIRDVNELLSLNLPAEEYDTLGGLVYDHLGKVPVAQDEVRIDGCQIVVLVTEGRRLRKLRVRVGSETATEH